MSSPILQGLVFSLVVSLAIGRNLVEQWHMSQQSSQTVCGFTDTSFSSKCYVDIEPEVYRHSTPVMRIAVVTEEYSQYCSGWLVGCDGHVITSAHCFGKNDSTTVANTKFEFMAEGERCDSDCKEKGACQTEAPITGAIMIHMNQDLDYALMLLPDGQNVARKYGYLSMQVEPAVIDQRIYIPQHSQGYGKTIALTDVNKEAFRIVSTNTTNLKSELPEASCAVGDHIVGYQAHTQQGSSGAPVISYDTDLVVALHYCGQCTEESGINAGVPILQIAEHLKSIRSLPRCTFPNSNEENEFTVNAKIPSVDTDGREAAVGPTQNGDISPAIQWSTTSLWWIMNILVYFTLH